MKSFSEEEKAVNLGIGNLSVGFWRHLVDSALQVGELTFREQHLLFLLNATDMEADASAHGFMRLAALARLESVQQTAARRLRGKPERRRLLRQTAQAFHWGVQKGRQLTGRLFRVEMIGGNDLGYTRLNENKIFINPIAIFRRVQHADDVVRGLIVHELGHHMYHRGEQEEAIWQQAEEEGIGRLLNLVADEHLERNLRALDDEYGNQLKRLGAYAFQHSRKEYSVDELLGIFRAHAFAVLSSSKLSVAYQRASVRVDAGRVLVEAERLGMSFPRFFRALRMGLGNRFDDPLVAEALQLFGKRFRHASMGELLEITRKLREIFQSEARLLNAMEQDKLCDVSESELRRAGGGLTNEEIQSEIQRIERKEDLPDGSGPDGGGGRCINVIPDVEFEVIDTVLPVAYSRAAHRSYATLIRPHAIRLRRFLQDLGSRYEPAPRRLHGSRLARPLLRRLVVQRDPRVLVARERRVVNDLFLGVVIDCSGSMDYADNMEKAKRFAMLVAESARGVHGIDVRLFGFTDDVIYDAGSAERPGVPALRAGGGNNDAAALWHASKVALHSNRKAKLIVMISDGLPTECSVAALQSLARKITHRMHICCAQAAVQPLEEECFDHYVLLNEDNIDTSVREFGQMIARLIRRATAVAS